MRILATLTFLIGLSFAVNAQKPLRDSVHYYERLYSRYTRRVWDSVRNSDSSRLLIGRLTSLRGHSRAYTAFTLFTEAAAADFGPLNKAIAMDGFGAFSGPVWRLGFGFSRKTYSGLMIDFNYFVIGLDRTRKSNGNEIKTNFSNVLEFEMGYAIVNTTRFDLYPYAGLSARSTTLNYKSPAVINPNYNSIASLILNNQSANGNSTHLGYEAGIGIDYAIYLNKKNRGGTMLFAKFGTDGSFGNEDYTISGTTIHSGIKYGAWIAQFGFKFFGRP
jgi:hypothetical protein